MLVFSDSVLKECNSTELASLLSVANAHNVKAVTDTVAQSQEAIRDFVMKRRQEEEAEANYTEQLEARFM